MEIQPGLLLDLYPVAQVLAVGGVDGILADPATIQPAGGGDDVLRARVDTVLVGEDVDSQSLDDGAHPFCASQSQVRSESNPLPFQVRVPFQSPFKEYLRLPSTVIVSRQVPLTEIFPLSAPTVIFMSAV